MIRPERWLASSPSSLDDHTIVFLLRQPMSEYAELIRRWKEAAILGSCGGVLGWDERTYMPRNGSAHRAEQMALIARLCHEMVTHPKIGELLAAAESGKHDE